MNNKKSSLGRSSKFVFSLAQNNQLKKWHDHSFVKAQLITLTLLRLTYDTRKMSLWEEIMEERDTVPNQLYSGMKSTTRPTISAGQTRPTAHQALRQRSQQVPMDFTKGSERSCSKH